LTFLFLNWSCKDDPTEDNVNISVMDEFNISMWENLNNNSRSFQLNIETIGAEFCENTLIETTNSTENGFIGLVINDIPKDSCDSPIFPATSKFEIGLLSNGTYPLYISLKEVIYNYGNLRVEEDYFELNMNNLDGISVPEKKLFKVPENMIWGFVAFENASASTVYDEFLNELTNVAISKNFQSGYYGYFSIEDNELTILNQNISHDNHQSFGLDFSGNNAEIIDLLDTYRNNYPDLEFKIFTSKGEAL